jgi:hypothetical protein
MSATYDGGIAESSQRDRAVVAGFTFFAGILMLMSGLWSFVTGLTGLIEHHFYAITRNYAFKIDITAWGWIHLILGIVVAITGIGLLLGQTWARVVGIILAVLSAVANFLFLPYYPFWSILVITLDVIIIWALAVYGRVVGSGAMD